MADHSDILIIGGGLNGPALALALGRAGMRVHLIDAAPAGTQTADTFDGRAYALALASQQLLRAIGMWDDLAGDAQPILEIIASDGRAGEGAGPFILDFHHGEIEEGPMGFMLEDRFLRRAFAAALAACPGVTVQTGTQVVAQGHDARGAHVRLADGTTCHARLIVGADGRQSGTAARAGIGRMGWDYGQTALVCAIAHELPHEGTAHQFFMPAGPLAVLPLPGNRCSIVWSERTRTAEAIAALDDAGFLAALAPRFGTFLGSISLAGPRFCYPLNLTLAKALAAPRLALVGDAAHGVHPIAGQGLNLGLRDVAALAEVVVAARRRGEDIGAESVLARYAQWRRFDTAMLAAGTDLFNRLFSNDFPLLRAARGLGMGAVAALPGLRRAFIREAAGLSGDVPRLLRGEPL